MPLRRAARVGQPGEEGENGVTTAAACTPRPHTLLREQLQLREAEEAAVDERLRCREDLGHLRRGTERVRGSPFEHCSPPPRPPPPTHPSSSTWENETMRVETQASSTVSGRATPAKPNLRRTFRAQCCILLLQSCLSPSSSAPKHYEKCEKPGTIGKVQEEDCKRQRSYGAADVATRKQQAIRRV